MLHASYNNETRTIQVKKKLNRLPIDCSYLKIHCSNRICGYSSNGKIGRRFFRSTEINRRAWSRVAGPPDVRGVTETGVVERVKIGETKASKALGREFLDAIGEMAVSGAAR